MSTLRAEQMVAKACWWIVKNPEKWEKLKQLCDYLRKEGDLIQRGNVYELARRYGLDVTLASEFKRDHNLWSVLARFMVMENPMMMSSIAFRSTPIDDVDLKGFYNDIIGKDSFVANSLEQAQEIYQIHLAKAPRL